MYDCLIIGCGIIGAAAAFEMSRYHLRAAVLEKENDVAMGTTKANSAIIHAGYDPEPGTLMARLNVEGARMAKELCTRLDVPYRQIGSMVLAFSAEEEKKLQKLYGNGLANGVPGLELLTGAQALALEPCLSDGVRAALLAPSAGIVSPWEYALALIETAALNGVELYRNCEVTAIRREGDAWLITAGTRCFAAKTVVNAAGVFSDHIHNMAAAPAFRILPNRGQYYLLDKTEGGRVSRVIFQCPSESGKGVLVSPTVHGNLIVGPNAEDVADGLDTATTAQGLAFVMDAARKSVPSLNFRESIRNFAGVRAVSNRDDFIIETAAPGFLDLAGIKSPGLSAAPAIAREAVARLAGSFFALRRKDTFAERPRRVRFKELPPEEKNACIQRNPLYGRVICRCETITEGEIAESLRSPVPPCSIDGVKRRVNAGMGRCQGGFCGPRVLDILARESGADPTEILQDHAGTRLLTGQTKESKGGACHAV